MAKPDKPESREVQSSKLPPFFKELNTLVDSCKTMEEELARANQELQRLHYDFQKEKSQHNQLRTDSQLKIQELQTLYDKAKAALKEVVEGRAQDKKQFDAESKRLKWMMQSELKRIQLENQQREAGFHEALSRSRQELATVQGFRQADQDSLRTLTAEMEKLRTTYFNFRNSVQGRETQFLKERADYEAKLGDAYRKVQDLGLQNEKLADEVRRLNQARAMDKGRLEQQVRELEERLNMERHYRQVETPPVSGAHGGNEPALGSVVSNPVLSTLNPSDFSDPKAFTQAITTELKKNLDAARSEVERMRKIHPLKTLVATKEFELMNVQRRLESLPAQDPQREKVEDLVKSVQEQRDRLQRILQESEQEISPRLNQ